VERLSTDWRQATLTEKQRAMLAYAEKLTRAPGEMARADVEALKTAGFTEPDILDINQITGYFAYVNRLADGLGVPLEAFWNDRGD
jgi:uncharacterized peroxidase-related enzyme